MTFPLALFFQPSSIFIIAIIVFIFIFYILVKSEHISQPPSTTVSGQVTDTASGVGVPDAEVPFTDSNGVDSVVAKTDANGNFSVAAGAGDYTLSKVIVNGVAIVIETMNITIESGRDTNIGVVGVSRVLTGFSVSGTIYYYLSISGSGTYANFRSSSNY